MRSLARSAFLSVGKPAKFADDQRGIRVTCTARQHCEAVPVQFSDNHAGLFHRLVVSVVRLVDDNLFIRRRLLRTVQVLEYRIKLLGVAEEL